MSFWTSGSAAAILYVLACLGGATLLRTRIAALQRLGIPDCIMAGVIGLVLGPSVSGLVRIDTSVLESVVYHGLALIFITVGLQRPSKTGNSGGGKSMAFAIPFLAVMQGFIGLALVLLISAITAEALHPGFGLLLPLGFNQGPGQALSMGQAWEASGLTDGSQIGLIIAAIGFLWAIVAGVPLIAWGKRRGLLTAPKTANAAEPNAPTEPPLPQPEGSSVAPLTLHLVFIGCVYLATYGIVSNLADALSSKPQLSAMVWGFHFLIGVGLALALRTIVTRIGSGAGLPLHDGLLGRTSSVMVDVVTCSALAAVQIGVLKTHLIPILVITTVGGGLTLFVTIWLARRAFPESPFEHGVVLFGLATGTLPMGLALLRQVDPKLEGPAPASAVLGAVGALVLSAPLLLVVLPIPVGAWPDGFPGAVWLTTGILLLYLSLLLLGWWKLGNLQFTKPMAQLWPPSKDDA
jgi:ESS family glutamate:Na+ symporter